jgi:UDP-N-acetylmuramyl pentapeptide phosphotransferase/UDP-N-acetylglucosamine-1-phosphate transferase
MIVWSVAAWALVAACTFALAASITGAGIAYAHRRRLLDQPGRRRSHNVPTPRGGGIGIVVGALFVIALVGALSGSPTRMIALATAAAVLVVGAVGWVDDHGSLRATVRLAAHALAAAVLLATPALSMDVANAGSGALALYVLAASVPAFGIVWSINLHNFMDGIDGLLTLQSIFVFCALALVFLHGDWREPAEVVGLFAIAAAGFLPFNFPRARVFMGDVGSGVLGLLVALAVLWQLATPGIASGTGIVLCSAFVTDATCTLLSRMLRGRRWYSAHREHLYQWLARSGFSHAQVVAFYLGWNLLIVSPVVCWMNRAPVASVVDGPAPNGFALAAAVYALAGATWWFGKRWCRGRARSRHALA